MYLDIHARTLHMYIVRNASKEKGLTICFISCVYFYVSTCIIMITLHDVMNLWDRPKLQTCKHTNKYYLQILCIISFLYLGPRNVRPWFIVA